MCVPLGYHVFVRLSENGKISLNLNHSYKVVDSSTHLFTESYLLKPYTAISESLISQNKLELAGKQICLMIKHYKEGSFTPLLSQLTVGSFVEISNFTGSFRFSYLEKCNELIMICAGTGFTPMVKLLHEGLKLEKIT